MNLIRVRRMKPEVLRIIAQLCVLERQRYAEAHLRQSYAVEGCFLRMLILDRKAAR